MFADNMLIYVLDENSAELERNMNIAFNIVEQWMSINKLKLKIEKTKCIILKSKKRAKR